MISDPSIWHRKEQFEDFTRLALRSAFFRELHRNNHAYRHILRFLGHITLGATFFILFLLLSRSSLLAGVLLYPVYLFFQALLLSGCMIHSHELSHNQIKPRLLNDGIGVISGMVCFINYYSFQRAHRFHHRNIGNLDTPEAGAPVSPKGQEKILHGDRSQKLVAKLFNRSYVLGFLLSWPIFILYGDYNSWLLPFKARGKVDRRSLLTFGLMVIVNLCGLVFFPWEYALLFFLPMLFGGQRILAITYMHHAHEDSVFFGEKHHNIFNVIMSSTDRDFGPLVNFFMLNNGYHIPHHLNPQIAYYDLERASLYLRETLPEGLSYNFYPNSRFYLDFANGLYEQRLETNHEVYRLKYLKPDAPGFRFLRRHEG